MTTVPLLDLTRLSDDDARAYTETFARVVKSGQFILGAEVDAFEKECAAFIGAKHALGVSSGTDALILALMALDIGQGDEVICPSFTFFATAGAIWRTGAKPVFVDITPNNFNIDAAAIERALTPKTKAIMPVHLFGQSADMDPIMALAKARHIPVIEDAAQAIGATDKGRQAGTFGAFGAFSFFPSKNLGGFGDSGLVTTNDDSLAARARMLRVHGMAPKYYHALVGGNFRIDALQAALLRLRLPKLDGYTRARQDNAAFYNKHFAEAGLGDALRLPVVHQDLHTWNQYVISVPTRRDALQTFLRERGVASEIYYPVPLHLQSCFAALGYEKGAFPHSETAASQVLALPIFPDLRPAERQAVVDTVLAFFKA